MATFDEIAALVRERMGNKFPVSELTSVQIDMGMHGDDVDAFLREYSRRFGVELGGFLWYFHRAPDGFISIVDLFTALFRRPPWWQSRGVQPMLITVAMLQQFAQVGRWSIAYPDHEPPQFPLSKWVEIIGMLVFLVVIFLWYAISQYLDGR